jgi:predicted ferric reductase
LLLLVALVPTVILIATQPSFTAPQRVIRAAALLGYAFIFMAIVSANYMQSLVRRFGRPFVTLHHWVSITGLVLITAHPVLLAITGGGLAVFVPDVSSWRGFWTYAGRPAWFLLLLAAAAAGLRLRFKNGWRVIHYLTYVAFVFGAVHATMLGTSFVVSPVARIVAYILAALAVAVFGRKRYEVWQRAKSRASRRTG